MLARWQQSTSSCDIRSPSTRPAIRSSWSDKRALESVRLRDRFDAKRDELLNALSLVRFGHEHVAHRVDGETVCAVELAGPVAGAAEGTDEGQRGSLEHVHTLIGAVGDEYEPLFGIDGEADVPHRAAAECPARDECLAHERAVLPEDLNPVVRPVAHVYQTVFGDLDRMHDPELGRWWIVGIEPARFIFVLHRAAERPRQPLSSAPKIIVVRGVAVPSQWRL